MVTTQNIALKADDVDAIVEAGEDNNIFKSTQKPKQKPKAEPLPPLIQEAVKPPTPREKKENVEKPEPQVEEPVPVVEQKPMYQTVKMKDFK